jgi:hypothetical protein
MFITIHQSVQMFYVGHTGYIHKVMIIYLYYQESRIKTKLISRLGSYTVPPTETAQLWIRILVP